MEILISFVGNTATCGGFKSPEDMPEECPNGRGSEGAVLSLCDSLKPDRVYLFPSCMQNNSEPIKNTEWRAEIIREKLAERNPD